MEVVLVIFNERIVTSYYCTFKPSHKKSKLEDRNVMSKTRTEIVIKGLLAGSKLTGLKI